MNMQPARRIASPVEQISAVSVQASQPARSAHMTPPEFERLHQHRASCLVIKLKPLRGDFNTALVCHNTSVFTTPVLA